MTEPRLTCYVPTMTYGRMAVLVMLASILGACDGETDPSGPGGGEPTWSVEQENLDGALLSVWGTADDDVWTVGGDARDGTGPLVLHYDGTSWERVETGQTAGDLWWVFGFEGGPIFMGGAGGLILRYEGGTFTPMDTPTNDTVFGIWGATPTDVWAVGGTFDTNGFAWRLNGDTWELEPSLPTALVADAAIWKVYGVGADDVWLVGSDGISLSWDGQTLDQADTGVGSSLFTVHANSQRYAAVGGLASGIIVENDGSGWAAAPGEPAPYGLTGVVLDAADGGYAVGQYGSVHGRTAEGWAEVDTTLSIQRDLHGVWMAPSGVVWAVGGQTASFPLVDGVLIRLGEDVTPDGQ